MNDDTLVLKIFQELMRLDTINPPGSEKLAADYLFRVFSQAGIPCEVQPLGGGRANFVAWIGGGGPVLELGGHLDVVPCPGDWRHPPLDATEEDGLFYGRGACDMKGGVAAMCAAALELFREKTPLRGTLRLAFVADEEHVNLGMRAYLTKYPAADWAVLGEPTDLEIAIAHRGVARFYVDLRGHAQHAALPSAGETAVHKAARAVLAIDQLNGELSGLTHPLLPPPSIVVTQLEGYEKDNVVACKDAAAHRPPAAARDNGATGAGAAGAGSCPGGCRGGHAGKKALHGWRRDAGRRGLCAAGLCRHRNNAGPRTDPEAVRGLLRAVLPGGSGGKDHRPGPGKPGAGPHRG